MRTSDLFSKLSKTTITALTVLTVFIIGNILSLYDTHYIYAAQSSGTDKPDKKIYESRPYIGKKSISICFDSAKKEQTDVDVEKKLREVGLKVFPKDTRTFRMKASGNKITHYFFCPEANGVLCLQDLGDGLNMISIIPTSQKISKNMPIIDSLSDGAIAFLDGVNLAIIDSSETVNTFNLSPALESEKIKAKEKFKISMQTQKINSGEEIIVIIFKIKGKEKKYGISRKSMELFELE